MNNREMDLLIAEKIMVGKKIVDLIYEFNEGDCLYTTDINRASIFDLRQKDRWEEVIPFNPTEDIAAAWQVVLKMVELTKWYDLTYRPTGALADFAGDIYHRAIVPFSEADGDRTKAQCKAICLAALKALEIEVKETI